GSDRTAVGFWGEGFLIDTFDAPPAAASAGLDVITGVAGRGAMLGGLGCSNLPCADLSPVVQCALHASGSGLAVVAGGCGGRWDLVSVGGALVGGVAVEVALNFTGFDFEAFEAAGDCRGRITGLGCTLCGCGLVFCCGGVAVGLYELA